MRVFTVFAFIFLSRPSASPAAPSRVSSEAAMAPTSRMRSRRSGDEILVSVSPMPKRRFFKSRKVSSIEKRRPYPFTMSAPDLSPRLVARCHGSAMPLACTHTTAATVRWIWVKRAFLIVFGLPVSGTQPKPRSASNVTLVVVGTTSRKRSSSASSCSFRQSFSSDFMTDFHMSGVARPCLVTRYSAIVDWLSWSKSVQSSATTISGRAPRTKGTQFAKSPQTSTPVFEKSRSTCWMACFASRSFAIANARPRAPTASRAPWRAPTVASAREATHFS